MRHAAMSTTSGQPTPMSSRLPPVMLASASGAYLSGSLPALCREREVDGVLGQHGDQREHGEGEALRDVELERLGPPGEQERGADDGEPEDDRTDQLRRVHPAEPHDEAGEGQGDRAADRQPLATRWATDAVPGLRRRRPRSLGPILGVDSRAAGLGSHERAQGRGPQGRRVSGSPGLRVGGLAVDNMGRMQRRAGSPPDPRWDFPC